ncbi:MAG: TonB-dependent receptor [Acidobacteria bacterium]|nr:TonB-dependent receptor [Acidobacteriota bacterium]
MLKKRVFPSDRLTTRWVACFLATLATVCFLAVAPVMAQQSFGNVRGIVRDETGASIGGAKITITEKATNRTISVQSGEDGAFQFNNLLVGEYQLLVEAQSFKTATLSGIRVNLNTTNDIPITMTVGESGETVEVSAGGTELVQSTTTTLAKSFNSRQMVDLAQTGNGSNTNDGIYSLALLSANVTSSGGVGVGSGGSVGGQRSRNNNFITDGIDNNDKSVTGPSVYVSPEVVAEFSLLANQYSAEFGRNTGGQFVTTTKSGSNEFHGTGYWYSRNRFLNALDTLQKNAGVIRETVPGKSRLARYDENRNGGNIGGPIIKDRLFFFTSFEGMQIGQASGAGGIATPTAEGFAILNSLSGLSAANLGVFNQYVPVAPANDSGSITVGGRQIPIGNVAIDSPAFFNRRNLVINLDFLQSDATQHRVRFIYNRERIIDTAANLPVFFSLVPTDGRLFSYANTHSFSGTVNNEFRFSFRRSDGPNILVPNLKFPGLDVFPNIGLLDLGLDIGPNSSAPSIGKDVNYQVINNFSIVKGNHSLKLGGDVRRLIGTSFFVQRVRGDYQYSNTDLFLRDISPDFLAERNVGGRPYHGNQWLAYVYAQDDWRLRQNLTLNLGVRYEYQQVPFGARQQVLNGISSVPGVLEFNEPAAEKKNFAPKIGLAYSPEFKDGLLNTIFGNAGQSSIRAGFSLGYDVIFDNLYTLSTTPQESATVNTQPSAAIPNYLANGGLPSAGPTITDPALARSITSAWIPDQKVPRAISYSLSIQRQLKDDWGLELRYLGTRGINLFTQNRINRQPVVNENRYLPTFLQMPSADQLNGLSLSLADLNALGGTESYVPKFRDAGFNGANVVAFTPNGNSTYHAFSASLTKRFSHGYQLTSAYTWSHLLDDSTAELASTFTNPRRSQDFQNYQAEKGNSALDSRHRFVTSAIYDLPFFAQAGNRLVRHTLGGWQLAGTLTFESGKPVTPQSGIDANLNGDSAGDRTIRNASGVSGTGSNIIAVDRRGNTVALGNPQTVAYVALNPNAEYIRAGLGALATSGRNTLRFPGVNNLDFSVFKTIPLRENYRLQFRADFYNVTNTPQYIPGSPNGVSPISTTSGSQFRTVLVADPNFNRSERGFSSNPRTIQLALRFEF